MPRRNFLTDRQRQIIALVATGASNKEIASQLEISMKTVANTLTTVFEKTRTQSRTELAVRWVESLREGIVQQQFTS
jgi:two-component system, NarL family, response regulator, fimbrial Z protein, FimZ